jgi:RNA polymerase-binding transcription factor DksA
MAALNSEQKEQISAALTARGAQLVEEIRVELERSGHQHFTDLAGEVTDAGDASVADMLIDHDISIVRRQVEELTQVEAAQKRVSYADYGDCEECGAEIGLQRLLAVPHATRCVGCQGQHEKMFAHESTPKL